MSCDMCCINILDKVRYKKPMLIVILEFSVAHL